MAQNVVKSDDGWIRHFDKSSSSYFLYNEVTGESRWEEEEETGKEVLGSVVHAAHKYDPDDGWVRHYDASSCRYYQHNPTTGQTEWDSE